MNPAIPGNVKVDPTRLNDANTKNPYITSTTSAISPGILYIANINNDIAIIARTPANCVCFMDSTPRVAPTVLTSSIFILTGNAPDFRRFVIFCASSRLFVVI